MSLLMGELDSIARCAAQYRSERLAALGLKSCHASYLMGICDCPGISQEQLARQVGVTTSFIGHLERGSRKASLETLVALANALHVGVDYLLCDSLNTVRNDSGPDGLSRGQRYVMHEILSTLQSHLDDWNGPSAEG